MLRLTHFNGFEGINLYVNPSAVVAIAPLPHTKYDEARSLVTMVTGKEYRVVEEALDIACKCRGEG